MLQYEQGGIKLADLTYRDRSLKFQWVRRLHDDNTLLMKLAMYYIKPLIRNSVFWECNFKKSDISYVCDATKGFWNDVVCAWAEGNYCEEIEYEQRTSQVLWLNSLIRIDHKPVFFKKAYQNGVIYFADLINNEGKLMSYQSFDMIYPNTLNYMDFFSLTQAIPRQWRNDTYKHSFIETKYEQLMAKEKWSPHAYQIYIAKSAVHVYDCLLNKLVLFEDLEELAETFQNIKKLTAVEKYKSFQYRLLHNAIYCTDRLKHCKILQHNLCRLCASHKETIQHLFFECSYAQELYAQVQTYLNSEIELTWKKIYTNKIEAEWSNRVNLMFLLAKNHIYSAVCTKRSLTIERVIFEYETIYECEYKTAMMSNGMAKFNKRWDIDLQEPSNNVQEREYVQQYLLNMEN